MFSFTVCVLLAVVPKVEVTPKSVTEMEGANVTAVCSASGSPVPVILWNLDMVSTHYEVRQFTSQLSLYLRTALTLKLLSYVKLNIKTETKPIRLTSLFIQILNTVILHSFSR